MVSNEETVKIVETILSELLSARNFVDADVNFLEDFDGEPIVRVTARLKEPLHNSEVLFQAADEIRDRLLKRGDERFVFVQQVSSTPDLDDLTDEESTEGDVQ